MKEKLKRKPEKVIKRKSYYGFSKKYPGACDRGTYLIGDSLTVKRKETAKKIIAGIAYIILFAAAYIITSAAILISHGGI